MSTTINSIGLILDILAGLILLRFGLPPQIDPQGHIHLILEQEDGDEKKLAKNYTLMSRIGVVLLIFGFLLQLASNYIP
jgi:hypothetical protein